MPSLVRTLLGPDADMLRLIGPDGRPLSDTQRFNLLQRWASDAGALASNATEGQPLSEVLRTPLMAQRITRNSPWPPSAATNASLALLEASLAARLGVQHGATLRQLSAAHYDNASSLLGADNVVLDGFSRIPEHMAVNATNRFGSRLSLRLGTPVVAIRHGDSNATVTTATGQTLRAQYVVCTVPLGVIKAGGVSLEPALPEASQAALERLGVGRLEKLWMRFDEVGGLGWGVPAAECREVRLGKARTGHAGFRLAGAGVRGHKTCAPHLCITPIR